VVERPNEPTPSQSQCQPALQADGYQPYPLHNAPLHHQLQQYFQQAQKLPQQAYAAQRYIGYQQAAANHAPGAPTTQVRCIQMAACL
jgi:hypothetical protein